MNKVGFKKIVLAVSIMLALAFTLNACDGGKSALVGRWELVEGTTSDNPEDMELLSDGTGIGYKTGITWKVEKDRFYMTHPLIAKSWGYKLQGSTLTLIMDNGEVLKYNKKEKCGDKWYNPLTQSCNGNEIANDRCNGKVYDLLTQSCKENEIVNDRCNGEVYNLLTQSCNENEIVNDRCNGKVYNLETEYCSDGDVKKYRTHSSVTYNSITHDGQAYKTVKIGEQTWMAENLNYNAEGSKCYDNDPANCEKYGRLYNLETAKKVCPSGWHLPSNADWDKLYRFADSTFADSTNGMESPYKSKVAGRYLKAKSGWKNADKKSGNGTDIFGFSALPGGGGNSDGNFSYVGSSGYWWSSSESGYAYDAYCTYIYYGSEYASWEKCPYAFWRYSNVMSYLYSVRCVMD
jgi:uncharacterized protein (TIGR02145 family)